MTDTDMQVIDLLESTGEATAGQLANLMGLTTGTFTAVLNRLEKAGLVRRERDPNDGRRVIVKLDPDAKQKTSPLFDSLEEAWEEMAALYDDEQKALLLDFLQRSNALAMDEVTRLREARSDDNGLFSAPLGNLKSARFVFPSEGVRLNLRAEGMSDALYQARFKGPAPDLKIKDGVVTMRYPRRLWLPGREERAAEVTLSTAIPWSIVIRSGGSEVIAELGGVDLLEMEANGAGSMFSIQLPTPSRTVPVRLGGGGSAFTVRRPPDIAARVQLRGWGSALAFDDQTSTGMSSDEWLQSPNYDDTAQRYDVEASGSGSVFTITTE